MKTTKDTKLICNGGFETRQYAMFVLFENCESLIHGMKSPEYATSYPPFDVAQDKLERVSGLIGAENKPGFPRARE